jgi:HPt (histidine-containing phosphotransfer) domain-containing protein
MAGPESDLSARIATIKQEFLSRLNHDWVPNLRDLRQRFIAAPTDPALLNQMVHAAHDMTGSGAIFGYEEISNHGRRLDDSLRQLIKHDVENTPERRSEIVDLIDQLERVCIAALSDLKKPDDSPRA